MKKQFVLFACVAALACACDSSSEQKKPDAPQKDQPAPPKRSSCCEAEKPEAPKESQTVKTEAVPEAQTASTPEVKIEVKQ